MDEKEFEFNMDFEEEKQAEAKAQPEAKTQPEVDQETLALAMALKKIKEDPAVRQVFASALQAEQPTQQQPQVDPREERIQKAKARLAELEAQYAQLPEDDPRRASVAIEIVNLRTELAMLEPILAVEKRIQPIEQNLVNARINELYLYAQNLLMTDPRYSQLTPEQKNAILASVREGLQSIANTNRQSLFDPSAPSYIEQVINSYAFQFMVPSPPHDPAVNQPTAGSGAVIPMDVLEEAKRDGVDVELVKAIYESEVSTNG